MTKHDVDAFVVDMKMLASILGHNDDVITEKFKDVFPDPHIEAALIALDDFAAMQTKANNLFQFINKPMTVQWHLLQYWFTQQIIHPQKANRRN